MPVRRGSLHSITMAASNAPSTRSATRIDGTPGKAISGEDAASLLITSACFPTARRANAIASCDPIESHERWIATPRARGGLEGLEFALASDEAGEVARAYGV